MFALVTLVTQVVLLVVVMRLMAFYKTMLMAANKIQVAPNPNPCDCWARG